MTIKEVRHTQIDAGCRQRVDMEERVSKVQSETKRECELGGTAGQMGDWTFFDKGMQ